MSAGIPDYIDVIQDKLSDIIARLARIEERQIKTTAMVKEVEAAKAPIVGSFGSAEIPEEK